MSNAVKQGDFDTRAEEELSELMILADEYLEDNPDKFKALEPILKLAVYVLSNKLMDRV